MSTIVIVLIAVCLGLCAMVAMLVERNIRAGFGRIQAEGRVDKYKKQIAAAKNVVDAWHRPGQCPTAPSEYSELPQARAYQQGIRHGSSYMLTYFNVSVEEGAQSEKE